jgi:hypothetical protein
MDVEENKQCQEFCFFPTIIGKGDNVGIQVWGRHPKAEEARERFSKKDSHGNVQ